VKETGVPGENHIFSTADNTMNNELGLENRHIPIAVGYLEIRNMIDQFSKLLINLLEYVFSNEIC
jgi:hypothetical protein